MSLCQWVLERERVRVNLTKGNPREIDNNIFFWHEFAYRWKRKSEKGATVKDRQAQKLSSLRERERERGVLKKKEMSIEQLIARGRERMCDIKREDMSDFQITIF